MKRFVLCTVVAWFAAVGPVSGLKARAQSKDVQEIRALEDRFAAAFTAKDVDAIMKFYVPGSALFVFDLVPPREYVGWDAYKKDWQTFLGGMPGPIKVDLGELSVESDGKIGYGHCIQHGTWTNPDGTPGEMTVRVSDVYRKIDGKWLIVMEHVSVPVDPTTGKADMMSKP
jgi:ketosteroid isomerase-like protein